MEKEKYLIVVVGPTAVGKTSLCIQLANDYNTEIVSADSRQIFKELNIGTAKPTAKEQQQAKHYFVDSHSIHDSYNAGDYERDAILKLDELFLQHDYVVLTGGSGLYVKAVTEGMAEMPEVDESIREKLRVRLAHEGLDALVSELKRCDPEYAAEADLQNPQRVMRALEIYEGTGMKFSSFRDNKKKKRNFKTIKIGLTRNRQELYDRINLRMDQMIEQGLFKEAEEFFPFRSINALQTVGYKEIFDFMEGKYDREEAVRLLKRNSRRYAKRQLTWFSKEEDMMWFHPDDYDNIKRYIDKVTRAL